MPTGIVELVARFTNLRRMRADELRPARAFVYKNPFGGFIVRVSGPRFEEKEVKAPFPFSTARDAMAVGRSRIGLREVSA